MKLRTMKIEPHKKFEGVFLVGGKPATLNLLPGAVVYGERLVKSDKRE